MITPDQFRVELARRLNEVLPEGFHATPGWDDIELDAPERLPVSKVEGTVLYLWYGPEENPTLRLHPIELTGEAG